MRWRTGTAIGTWTWWSLIRRQALAAFQSVYQWIQTHELSEHIILPAGGHRLAKREQVGDAERARFEKFILEATTNVDKMVRSKTDWHADAAGTAVASS